MSRLSQGRMDYDAIAEELPELSLADLDASVVKRARDYAKRAHKKWPPRPVSSGMLVQIFSVPGISIPRGGVRNEER